MGRIGGSTALVAALSGAMGAGMATAEPPQVTLTRGLTAEVAAVVEALAARPGFWEAILESNALHADSTPEELIAFDDAWRAGDAAVIDPIMDHAISQHIAVILKERKGHIAEIIVMDAKGANVAAYPKTSDYFQGDEEKWQLTFPLGDGAEHAGDVEFDESTGVWAQQVSATLMMGREPVGAITVGFDIRYSSR